MKYVGIYICTVIAALCGTLFAGCTDALETTLPESSDVQNESVAQVDFSVSEAAWERQSVALSRSIFETLDELKEKGKGFGIYCDYLYLQNQPVTWDVETGRWDYGDKLLWANNKWKDGEGNLLANIYAYAPYDKTAGSLTGNKEKTNLFFETDYAFGTDKTLEADNTKDLLWAEYDIDDNGVVYLVFNHALAKLSFGSVVNTYGSAIRLMKVEVSGTAVTQGDLSLADGKWSYLDNDKKEFTYTKKYTTTIEETDLSRTVIGKRIAGGDAELFGIDDLLFIPGPTVTVKIYLQTQDGDEILEEEAKETDWEGDLTIGKDDMKDDMKDGIKLEQGKNTEINLTVGKNHEVVIQ